MSDLVERLYERYEMLAAQNSHNSHYQESLDYYRAEKHLNAMEDSGNPRPSPTHIVNWVLNVRRLDVFVKGNGRMPRQNSRLSPATISPKEQQLATWVRTQRVNEANLCDYQSERLETIQGFSWEPIVQRWSNRLIEYARFTELHGRAPRLGSNVEHEHQLADWARRQRARRRQGKLNDAAVIELEALPLWRWQ
jgi:hypothetical protein